MNTQKSATDQKDVSLPMSDDPLFGLITKNKNILIVGVLLVVIVVVVVKLYSGHSESKEQQAWADFHKASTDVNAVAALSGIIDDSSGTTAEPWVLYYLAIRAFKENDLVTAKEKIDLLESNCPDHFLLKNPEWAPSIKRKILAEIEWCEQNPLPADAPEEEEAAQTGQEEPESSPETAPEEPTSSDG